MKYNSHMFLTAELNVFHIRSQLVSIILALYCRPGL